MARNRFENYISNQYTSQFTPTPIDANMGLNVINARQGYYDNVMKAIDQLNPDLQYIAPNQFDQGDLPIANELFQSRAQEQQSLIDDILKTDNLNDAARRVSKLANDPTYKQKAEALKMRKLQYDQNRKMLEDQYGKDAYFNDYLTYYEQNRLTPFDVTNYGLNSAIGAQTPDASKLAKDWASILEYDEIPLGNGSFIGKTGDSGEYYISVDGKRQTLSPEKVASTLTNGMLGDPTVQNWLSTMNRIGQGEKAFKMIESQINAVVAGKSFNRTQLSYDQKQNDEYLLRLKNSLENPENPKSPEQTDSLYNITDFANLDTFEAGFEDVEKALKEGDKTYSSPGSTLTMGSNTPFMNNNKQPEIVDKYLKIKESPTFQLLMAQNNLNPKNKNDINKGIKLYNNTIKINSSREEYYNPLPTNKQEKVNEATYGSNKAYYDYFENKTLTFNDLDFDWKSALKIGTSKSGIKDRVSGDVIRDKSGRTLLVSNNTNQETDHYSGYNQMLSGRKDPNSLVKQIILPTADGNQTSATVIYYFDPSGKKRALTMMDKDKNQIMNRAQNTKNTKDYFEILKNDPLVYDEQEVEDAFNYSFDIKYPAKITERKEIRYGE
jgi:hypothetical protein